MIRQLDDEKLSTMVMTRSSMSPGVEFRCPCFGREKAHII